MRVAAMLKVGPEDDIPDPNPTPIFDPAKDRIYLLSMRANLSSTQGDLEFYFKEYPPDYNSQKDGPLEMSVPKAANGTRIVLRLDPYWNWHFRRDGEQVTLGRQVTPPSVLAPNRYAHLIPAPAAGLREVSFIVQFLDNMADWNNKNRDPINIYVDFDQANLPDGTPIGPLSIKIDPDIRNPGDPP